MDNFKDAVTVLKWSFTNKTLLQTDSEINPLKTDAKLWSNPMWNCESWQMVRKVETLFNRYVCMFVFLGWGRELLGNCSENPCNSFILSTQILLFIGRKASQKFHQNLIRWHILPLFPYTLLLQKFRRRLKLISTCINDPWPSSQYLSTHYWI